MNAENQKLATAFKRHLQLEQALTPNSISAYLMDLGKLVTYAEDHALPLDKIEYEHLETFVASLYDCGIAARSIARIIAGIKSFYRFLYIDQYIQKDPTELLETPKLGLHLPTVLSVEEIDRIIDAIDYRKNEGLRNRAIIEVLYSCGLRVSELCHLKLSDVHPDEAFVHIYGKGRKERLVPISHAALDALAQYLASPHRPTPKAGEEEYIFLSRLGKAIARNSIFDLIRALSEEAGITKTISPHTFRHSFATHLLDGGANLQAIRLMLGHEDISTTEIYTHIDTQTLREEILLHHPRNKPSSQTQDE